MFLPGHGETIADPVSVLDALVRHRRERERQILDVLSDGDAEICDIVSRLYADTPRPLWPAAARNVLAHLVALWEEGRVLADPDLGAGARYRLA
jgi:hydroxyacylglutathione hydrolase